MVAREKSNREPRDVSSNPSQKAAQGLALLPLLISSNFPLDNAFFRARPEGLGTAPLVAAELLPRRPAGSLVANGSLPGSDTDNVTALSLEDLRPPVFALEDSGMVGSPSTRTGVYRRQPLPLLEGATFVDTNHQEIPQFDMPDGSSLKGAGVVYVLSDGTIVPPMTVEGYERLRQLFPSEPQAFDEKLMWLLKESPFLPIVADGLETGTLSQYVKKVNGKRVFQTDDFLEKVLFADLRNAAEAAHLTFLDNRGLLIVHLKTMQFGFFAGLWGTPSGTLGSFNEGELKLTDDQYLYRSLLTKLPWAEGLLKAYALSRAEERNLPARDLGRGPLPTPTAAEEAPSVHAVNVSWLEREHGVRLFPEAVQGAAHSFRDTADAVTALEDEIAELIKVLGEGHGSELVTSLNNFDRDSVWKDLGFPKRGNLGWAPWIAKGTGPEQALRFDPSTPLGRLAMWREIHSQDQTLSELYTSAWDDQRILFSDLAQADVIDQNELFVSFATEQIDNRAFWEFLVKNNPSLSPQLESIIAKTAILEAKYREASLQETEFFLQLQEHGLDMTSQALAGLTVAMARKHVDFLGLADGRNSFPGVSGSKFPSYYAALYRDVHPMSEYDGRFGFDPVTNPGLAASDREHSTMFSYLADLHHDLVMAGQLEPYDTTTFTEIILVGNLVKSGVEPARLPDYLKQFYPIVLQHYAHLNQLSGIEGEDGSGPHNPPFAWLPASLNGRWSGYFSEVKENGTFPISAPVIESNSGKLQEKDTEEILRLLFNNNSQITFSGKACALLHPELILSENGTLDLKVRWKGEKAFLRDITSHSSSLFFPIYMREVPLPRYPTPQETTSLQEAVLKSRWAAVGHLPPSSELP
jgi:hypothetical protein